MVMDANEKVDGQSNEDIYSDLKIISVSEEISSNEIYPNADVDACKLQQCEALVESEPRTVSCGMDNILTVAAGCSFDSFKDLNARISHCHSKKVIKHALRQQAKRRRKNIAIASGNSSTLPRIVVKSRSPHLDVESLINHPVTPKAVPATMREVLASIPGFSIKPRKRSSKKLSAAAQLEQTKEGCIDLETPDSILVNTNLRALLNKHTFSSLPPLYQYKLIQLLPDVDRAGATGQPDTPVRLSTSGLNNEFFARACLEWRERLAEGEFTPENRQKLKTEAEKEKSRLDPWKLKHFEPIWGERNALAIDNNPLVLSNPTRPSLKTTIKLRPSSWVSTRSEPRRLRTVGAITRAVASYREETTTTEEGTEHVPHCQGGGATEVEAVAEDGRESDEGEVLAQPFTDNAIHDVTLLSKEAATAAEKRPLDECELQERKSKVMKECEQTDDIPLEGTDIGDAGHLEIHLHDLKCGPIDSGIIIDNYLLSTEECSKTHSLCQDKSWTNEQKDVENELLDSNIPAYDSLCTLADDLESDTSLGQELDSSILQEDSLTHEILSDTETMTYEPNVVHEDDVIHESAILNSSCILVCSDISNPFEIIGYETPADCTNKDEQASSSCVEESGDVNPEEMEATLFTAAATGDDCWQDVEPTSKETLSESNLEEAQLIAVEGEQVSVDAVEAEGSEEVKVIPMQEELEVRLEEGSFPVAAEDALALDWPYAVKVESAMTAEEATGDNNLNRPQYQEYSTGQAVKLELEVTLTPEVPAASSDNPVASTVGCGANTTPTVSTPSTMTTVIPPTTIVCLPSVVSSASMMNNQTQLISCMSMPCSPVPTSSSAVPYLSLTSNTPMRALPTQIPKLQLKGKAPRDSSQALSTSNRSTRGPSNKPPPGAVNLERSYQICQAVIQNSPNRDQLQCQLKPPPALLAANTTPTVGGGKKSESRAPTQYGVVTSSRNGNKGFTPPLPAAMSLNNGPSVKPAAGKVSSSRVPTFQHRQSSPPVVVRHVFTSSQGIPVTMAVLPQAQASPTPEMVDSPASQSSHVGQYILVQRTGVGDQQLVMSRNGAPPRASSAPPSNHQAFQPAGCGMGRGRPASVDVEQEHLAANYGEQFMIHCPNPGTQAVSRRERDNGGIPPYGDIGSDNTFQNYTVVGDSESMPMEDSGTQAYPATGQQIMYGRSRRNPNERLVQNNHMPRTDSSHCACNLKAMIICQKCGAFCHDDCITPSRLCTTCFIR